MKDNTRHPIDELFKNKLNEDQPVFEDSLWNEVESVLDSRKKKRRFLILMFSFLVMVLGTGGYFLLSNKPGHIIYTSATPQRGISAQNSIGNAVATNTSGETDITKPKDNVASNASESSSISSNKSNNSIDASHNLSTISSINNGAANNNTLKASSSATARKSIAASKRHKASTSAIQASTAVESQSGSLVSGQTDKTISANVKPDSINYSVSIDANTINANNYLKGNLTSSENVIADTSVKKPEVAQSDELTKPKKPTHKSLMKWYVEVDGAYMDNIHLVGAPTSVNPNYDNIRGTDEKPLATFNYMFKVGFVRKKLQFNTGLGITNLGEKVEYKNHNDTTGNPIIHSGSVFERNGSYVNEYLTVPLQVAVLIPVKAVRLQLGGGIAASTPVRWNSYYLNKQVDGLEDPGSLKMVNKIVLNFNFTFGLEIPFTRHWAALASFEYTRDLTSVFKSGYGVKQEYLGPGGSLGLRYSFAR